MTLVSTVTVGAGGASSIEFTGIPQTGTDLLVLLSGRGSAGGYFAMRFNSSTTSYTERNLYGDGSAVGSGTDTLIYIGAVNSTYTANTFGNASAYIPNYAGSTYKSVSVDSVRENNATASYLQIGADLWSNTSAITSITLLSTSSNFVQYSTASLYTITKGSGGATVA